MVKVNNILSIFVLTMLFSASSLAQVTKSNLDQNADQTQGNYAATNLNYLGGVGSLGMIQNAWKDPLQNMGEGQLKPGYSKYYWTPDLVLPVRVREGMYTLINFPSWEVIENVYLGDGVSFTAQIQGPSSLMVYPDSSQFVCVDTNMIVFGRSGNKYVFYVQSETVNTDRITNAIIDIEVVNKNSSKNSAYPQGGTGYIGGKTNSSGDGGVDSTYTRDLQKEDWIERIPVDPTQFRFDIEVYVPNPDDIIIAPERVWRDNIFTYIDLGEKALTAVQRPIVTLIVERSETPVGFRAAGPNNRLIVVEGMGDMVLRSGKRIVCLKLRRADSDGLENTVYAKTNDWDLQNAHASRPTEVNEVNSNVEDVYSSSANNASDDKKSFFDFSSFFSSSKQEGNTSSGNDININVNSESVSGNVSGGLNVNSGNINSKDISSRKFTIDSIPLATPVVSKKDLTSDENALEGEVNIKVGKEEDIIPEYKNQDLDIVDSVDATSSKISQAETLGNSSNNSSPILISSQETLSPELKAKTEALLDEFRNSKVYENQRDTGISIELGTDENVNNLEKLWDEISKRHSATIGKYQPFYSVDTSADGQGKEIFHLRVGPVESLEDGDNVCSQLGRNGIFCSVVRFQ